MPCPTLFLATADLPAFVRGPVDFKAFRRLAVVLLSIRAKDCFGLGELELVPSLEVGRLASWSVAVIVENLPNRTCHVQPYWSRGWHFHCSLSEANVVFALTDSRSCGVTVGRGGQGFGLGAIGSRFVAGLLVTTGDCRGGPNIL